MTDAKKIRDILRLNLGPDAPISEQIIVALATLVNGSSPGVGPIVDFSRVRDPSTIERFRKALRTLKSATSALIEETGEALDLALAFQAKWLVADARTTIAHLEQLYAEVDLALSRCGPLRRQPDQRSRWYPTARAFADFIESGYRNAGMVLPSRSHIASPLVRAVRDLLAELGINCTPDQVAKVLHSRSEKIALN